MWGTFRAVKGQLLLLMSEHCNIIKESVESAIGVESRYSAYERRKVNPCTSARPACVYREVAQLAGRTLSARVVLLSSSLNVVVIHTRTSLTVVDLFPALFVYIQM